MTTTLSLGEIREPQLSFQQFLSQLKSGRSNLTALRSNLIMKWQHLMQNICCGSLTAISLNFRYRISYLHYYFQRPHIFLKSFFFLRVHICNKQITEEYFSQSEGKGMICFCSRFQLIKKIYQFGLLFCFGTNEV